MNLSRRQTWWWEVSLRHDDTDGETRVGTLYASVVNNLVNHGAYIKSFYYMVL